MAKIYDYVRIDIDTGEVTEEKSYDYEGPVLMCGGGTSGSFTFPSGNEASNVNQPKINYSSLIEALMDEYRSYYPSTGEVGGTAGGGTASPFEGEVSPDPETFMAATGTKSQARMDTNLVIVDALDEDADFNTYTDSVKTKIDSVIASIHTVEKTATDTVLDGALAKALEVANDAVVGTPLAAMVVAYETRIRRTYVKAMSRISAGFADINAVNSSAYVFALASIERQMMDDVDHYDAQLDITAYQAAFSQGFNNYMSSFRNTLGVHTAAILEGVRDVSQMLGMKLQANNAATNLQAELNRIRHASAVDEHQNQLAIDESDAMFESQFAVLAGNALATSGGAAMVPGKMTKSQSTASGIAAGAAIGLEVGGPVGAGVGAIAGGIAGYMNN